MEVEIDLLKSVDGNAGIYFDLAKKAKKKVQGAQEALEDSRKKLQDLLGKEEQFWEEEKKKDEKKDRKTEWYEKFHWFFSSEGFLCIGGKDATSNEMVIKKHLDPDDLVFHTDMAGSPFFVVKHGQNAGEKTRQETAQAVAMYSRAWKLGHQTADVFYVKPDQVTKEAKAGEHLGKGSFMIMGKTSYMYPKLECALGLLVIQPKQDSSREAPNKSQNDGSISGETSGTSQAPRSYQIIGGPISAVEHQTKNYMVVIPGKEKKSSLAKKIRSKLKGGELDDIIKFLPAGGGEVKR